jgi:hypothetical protein
MAGDVSQGNKSVGAFLCNMAKLIGSIVIYIALLEGVLILSKTRHFVSPPPPVISNDLHIPSMGEDSTPWFSLGIYLVMFLVIIIHVAISRSSSHDKPWDTKTFCWLIVGLVGSLLIYYWGNATWTCEWKGNRFVTGMWFTEHGKQYVEDYVKEHRDKPSCDTIIADHPAAAERVWSRDSLTASENTLGLAYLMCVTIFAVTFIGGGHSLFTTLWGSRH